MSKKLDEAYLEALDKIADLEAKLAEKEKEIQNWETMYRSVMQSCHNGIEEDKRLREQLAEKEKELDKYKTQRVFVPKPIDNDLKKLCNYEAVVIAEPIVPIVISQDKISFCIEQFEKLKEKVICGVLDTDNDFWNFTLKKGDAYILDDALLDLLEQEFDNQIEQLKKEMK